jgi:prepilin-type N-terminal cleavage/methylation domain-containing protein
MRFPDQIMKNPKQSDKFKAAFTMVELLVVIVIIAVLAAVLFSLTLSMRKKASSATSAANLRQVSTGIVAHASDMNGTLPGPVLTDQFPRYQNNSISGQLGWLLMEYFSSIPQPDASQPRMFYTPELDYPAARSGAKNGKSNAKPTYVLFARQQDAVTGATFWPMGNYNQNSAGNRTPPMTMIQLSARNTRGNPWITEMDQIIRPSSSRYGSEEKPPHGSFRNTLMFDFSVKAVPLAEFDSN